MSEAMERLSPEQKKELWATVKRDNPPLAEFITAARQEFPGAIVEHVKVGDIEAGTTARREDCFPFTVPPKPGWFKEWQKQWAAEVEEAEARLRGSGKKVRRKKA